MIFKNHYYYSHISQNNCMTVTVSSQARPWSSFHKICFRFFFIYFILYTAPWEAFNIIPGIKFLIGLYNQGLEWAVITSNEHLFRVFGVRHVQQVFNGSGDTSYSWAAFCFMLMIAGGGALIWSVADRKAKSYRQLNYLLCLFIRYSIALIAFGYGIIKIFAMQMPFPQISQLATPLGDLLPMRFSWMFIGYSTPYQVFSGVMEVLVALLLLYRRTATLGVMIATAVFTNVMVLNLAYDIPVKLFSINIVVQCLYLLANEYERMICFFVLNKPAKSCSVYDQPLTKKWMRITRIILKAWFIFLIAQSLYETYGQYRENNSSKPNAILKPGVYDVNRYIVNGDSLNNNIPDSIRWKDLIIDNGMGGSVASHDTIFRQRYGRGYFNFEKDSSQSIIHFTKMRNKIFSLHYQLPDSNTILLWGQKKNDSLFIELKRSVRRFQLAERQFHWLSEANR